MATHPFHAKLVRQRSVMVVSALAVGLALVVPSRAPANWKEPFAGALNIVATDNVPDSVTPTSIATIGGAPFVAWSENNGTNDELHVKQLGPSGWTAVGDALNINSSGDADDANIADVAGVPYVAWSEFNGSNHEIHVKRFDGASWTQPVATSLNVVASKDADLPSVTSVGGVPYVAWEETNGTKRQLYVKRLSGGVWTAVGGALNVDTSHGAFHLNITSIGGVPYVIWDEFNGTNNEVFVKRFDGASWTLVGAGALNVDSTKGATHPSIADVGGVPYATWDEFNGTTEAVHVKRFDGSSWTAVGGTLNVDPTKTAEKPDIASVGGVPFVVWREQASPGQDVDVKQFTGGEWRAVDSTLDVNSTKSIARARIASVGGAPYVAWVEYNGTNGELRVKRLEPDFLSQNAVPTKTGATLTTRARTYGLRFRIGFQYGTAFGHHTTTDTAPTGSDIVKVRRTVGGLSAATSYKFRPFAIAGVPSPLALGPIGTFRPDIVPPRLKLSGRKKQKLSSKVSVKALCGSEDCALTATGKVLGFKFKAVHAKLKRGVRGTLRLKLSQKARAAVAQAVAAGQTVKAKLVVTATDLAGNRTTERRGIRLL